MASCGPVTDNVMWVMQPPSRWADPAIVIGNSVMMAPSAGEVKVIVLSPAAGPAAVTPTATATPATKPRAAATRVSLRNLNRSAP